MEILRSIAGMPNPYPTALRARAVHAYEAGDEAYAVVAARFEVGVATLGLACPRTLRLARLYEAPEPVTLHAVAAVLNAIAAEDGGAG